MSISIIDYFKRRRGVKTYVGGISELDGVPDPMTVEGKVSPKYEPGFILLYPLDPAVSLKFSPCLSRRV